MGLEREVNSGRIAVFIIYGCMLLRDVILAADTHRSPCPYYCLLLRAHGMAWKTGLLLSF